MNIHPTAIIEDGAILGSNIKVGPYAIVGSEVVLGNDCTIEAHAVLTGKVKMGDRNYIGYGTIIGPAPQDLSYTDQIDSSVEIGSENTFREYVTVHRATKDGGATVIGDHNFLMTASHVGHDVRMGNHVIMANNCLLAGHVEVQDKAVLGGGTVFHQFMRVGRLAMVRGGTRFGKDIPPYTVGISTNRLSGLNTIGLKRAGFSPALRLELKHVFRLIFREGLNFKQALEQALQKDWSPEIQEFLHFISSSKRGVCPANQRNEEKDGE